MDEKRLVELISRSVQGIQTEQEAAELRAWTKESNENRELYNYFRRKRNLISDMAKIRYAELAKEGGEPAFDEALDKFYSDFKALPRKPSPIIRLYRRRYLRSAAAVTILFTMGLGVWKYSQFYDKELPSNQRFSKAADLPPGSEKAILTLLDGKKIVLDKTAKGQIASQGNMKVFKNDSSIVTYSKQPLNHNPNRKSEEEQFNVIETPRGGQYRIVLPDGTKVWLDAASSIRFPVSFSDSERLVTITGQVYFEVSIDKDRPFKVEVNGERVEVLGTDFNIRAYQDGESPIKTTLVNGSIKILAESEQIVLHPGEVATFLPNHGLRLLKNIDAGDDIAWTKGRFQFNRASIETIMGDLSRWYNVDVVYEGKPKQTISGNLRRNNKASDVLNALKASGGVDFRIDGNKIIVLAN